MGRSSLGLPSVIFGSLDEREKQVRACSAFVLIAAIAICCTPAGALTLTGALTPAPAVVYDNPCPIHPGYACTTTAPDITHLPTGRNVEFETAFYQALPGEWDPTGWTLNWSTQAIDAVLNVTTYRAFAHGSGAPDAGAELRIQWTPTAEQSDLKWIQGLHTNRSRQGIADYTLDIYTFTANKPPLYPYQYTDHRFYDAPTRNCEVGQDIYWQGLLYLARVDRTNKIATIYEGLSWGFTIDCSAVPEPSSLIGLIVGSVCLLVRRTRRMAR